MDIYFFDDKYWESYKNIWGKVRKSIKKEFDSKSVYNNEFLKPKIKSGKYSTDFCDKDAPEVCW